MAGSKVARSVRNFYKVCRAAILFNKKGSLSIPPGRERARTIPESAVRLKGVGAKRWNRLQMGVQRYAFCASAIYTKSTFEKY